MATGVTHRHGVLWQIDDGSGIQMLALSTLTLFYRAYSSQIVDDILIVVCTFVIF